MPTIGSVPTNAPFALNLFAGFGTSCTSLLLGEDDRHGDAAWYGGVTAAADGLFVAEALRWFGFNITMKIYLDSSAALGVCLRIGVGKIRSLEVKALWLQATIREKELSAFKIKGLEEPS